MVIHFPSVLQLLPECFRTPDTNLIPSQRAQRENRTGNVHPGTFHLLSSISHLPFLTAPDDRSDDLKIDKSQWYQGCWRPDGFFGGWVPVPAPWREM